MIHMYKPPMGGLGDGYIIKEACSGGDLESSRGKALAMPCFSQRLWYSSFWPIGRVSSWHKMRAHLSTEKQRSRVWYLQTWEGKCFPAVLRCSLRTPEWTSLRPPRGRATPGQSRRGQWWKRYWTELPGGRNEHTTGCRNGGVRFLMWKDYCNCLPPPLPKKASEVIWLLGTINTQGILPKK